MATCVLCGGPNSEERAEAGRSHCTKHSCIAEWRSRRIEDAGLVLVQTHKQGLMWVKKDSDAVTSTGRRR